MAVEIKKESETNQREVQAEIHDLRETINRYEETLINEIKEKENQEMNKVKNFKQDVQGEQQNLIVEIFNYATVKKEKEPQKMSEAKRRFNTYKETASGKLLQMKVPPRIQRHIPGLNKLKIMATDIRNIKLEEKRPVQNEGLVQRLTAGKNGQQLDLASLELNDADMETLADELASNKVSI